LHGAEVTTEEGGDDGMQIVGAVPLATSVTGAAMGADSRQQPAGSKVEQAHPPVTIYENASLANGTRMHCSPWTITVESRSGGELSSVMETCRWRVGVVAGVACSCKVGWLQAWCKPKLEWRSMSR
jgi:hypothetical protein